MTSSRYLLTLLALIAVLAGCHAQPQRHDTIEPESRFVNHETLDEALQEIDGLSLRVISGGFKGSLAEAIDALSDVRVILVGETHNRYEDHLVQLAILRALHQRDHRIALGVEWFQQDVQQHLDDYLAGNIDEAEMLRRTEYYQRWRFDYRHYRPIMEYARRHRLPVLALNAPVSLTRQVGRAGLESLSREERQSLPATLDRDNAAYVERIRKAYEAHGEGQQPFDRFLTVQLLWDETMARNSANYLKRHPDQKLVVFAGTGHAGYQAAIPDRLIRRLPVSTATVVTQTAPPDRAPEAGSADVVVVGPALDLTPSGKLGVLIQTQEDRVVISRVLDSSGAYRSGIRAGDQIISLDGRSIRSFSDLKLALLHRQPGEQVDVEVKSERQPLRGLTVILQ